MNTDNVKDFLKKKQNVKKTVNENIQFTVEESETTIKKRGRKPKGGKLIIKQQDDNVQSVALTNVI